MASTTAAVLRAPIKSMPAILGTAFGDMGANETLRHDLTGVVGRALKAARAAGRDYMGQTEAAARAVAAVRPDLSLRQATFAVDWLRDHVAG